MKRQNFNDYITDNDFSSLFNQMGWNNSDQVAPTVVQVEEDRFKLECVAQRNGFKVYTCDVTSIPLMSIIKIIDKRLRRSSNDYILIFISSSEQLHHEWIVPVKTVDKRVLVPIEYTQVSQLDFLYSKHLDLSFDIEEESTILDVTKKVHSTFELNSEKITKDFYAGFRKQHNLFAEFITGIDVEGDKQWYVSVMLNRLMFCYFIQKKNFLDFNPNYLREKLEECKKKEGKDKFFKSFYKSFLVQLFQGGLNDPKHDTPEFKATFGRIPYLNGGMFDQHQIEKQYQNIDIADEAFENLFNFFDKYHWHLDTRIEASGKDINPDVLGYIFEQYINDRAQMGAYYTKEDITNYIGKNCILPCLWDKTADSVNLKELWNFLQNSGDEYIYDSVKYGLLDSNGGLRELPEEIENGIDISKENLLERRKIWNTPTEESFALPTEIWRETVERRTRYLDLVDKIKKGKISQINDFITLNLDIIKFTHDVLHNTNDAKLLTCFYHAMQNVTILDPTCGSGAFLFAAMNILEPLYDICLDRMEEFNQKDTKLFSIELEEIKNKYRSNRAYFIYKNIILKNLYGVDIMNEATEIAKLRLFLKMVAVVEADRRLPNLGLDPLPDIDFNIRCGNTLVGYTSEADVNNSFNNDLLGILHKEEVQQKISKVADTYKSFQKYQLIQTDNISEFKKAKTTLQKDLKELNSILNTRLHDGLSKNIDQWLLDTKPFHWFAEFYGIIHGKGGFDVIIGNPPYVVYTKKDSHTKKAVSDFYSVGDIETKDCNNLYAFVIEKSFNLMNPAGRNGMIIPISSVSNPQFEKLREIFLTKSICWFSSYSNRPGKLFQNVEQRLTIFISQMSKENEGNYYSSSYKHWYGIERGILFDKLSYIPNVKQKDETTVCKIGTTIEESIKNKIFAHKGNRLAGTFVSYESDSYYHNGPTYFIRCMPFMPNSGKDMEPSSHYKKITCKNNYLVSAILNSSLYYWFYKNYSNCRDFSEVEINPFPIGDIKLDMLDELSHELAESYNKNKSIKNRDYNGTITYYEEYYPAKSKLIIDKIDAKLAKHYGFTNEELDFIINYDIKYRMGDDLNNEEE